MPTLFYIRDLFSTRNPPPPGSPPRLLVSVRLRGLEALQRFTERKYERTTMGEVKDLMSQTTKLLEEYGGSGEMGCVMC